MLHFQVPMFRHPLRLIGVYGITTGLGYAIRAFTVFGKEAPIQPRNPVPVPLPWKTN
jgi:hypothetical protein